ncbi:MAG: DUF5683 domain-containing protein [Spirosomaceae bacterium]|nr:DUF5683 domain-containing protein [Spirosomataceae bacterium]
MFVSSKTIPLAKHFLNFLLLFTLNQAFAQTDSLASISDTLIVPATDTTAKEKKVEKPKKPQTGVFRQALYLEPLTLANKPGAAFIRSAVPGLGQITNGQNWKAPIVWVAATGGIATIRFWGSRFKGYRKVIIAETAAGETSSTFQPAKGLFDGGLNIGFKENTDVEAVTIDNTRFNTVIERYRRYRDLSVIGFTVGYLVVGVEAYVAAHLKNFDVSDDISLQIKPMVQPNLAFGTAFGATLQLNFK